MSAMDQFRNFISRDAGKALDTAPTSEPTLVVESPYIGALPHYAESAGDDRKTTNLIKLMEADTAREERLIAARTKARSKTIFALTFAFIAVGGVLAYAAYIAVDGFHAHLGLVLSNGWAKVILTSWSSEPRSTFEMFS